MEPNTEVDPLWPEADRRSVVRSPAEGRRRRLRDRLEAEGLHSSALSGHAELRNALLLCDDDMRQTAQALGGIEAFVMAALRVLEKHDVTREDVMDLLREDVQEKLDSLADSLNGLRRSLRTIAGKIE